jgi:hypothetical protein
MATVMMTMMVSMVGMMVVLSGIFFKDLSCLVNIVTVATVHTVFCHFDLEK